jgi:hypothetical protein
MEHEELTPVADELAKSLHAVLDVLKGFDNGENCPSCGEDYTDDFSCQNDEDCCLVQAENLLARIGA